MIILAQIIHRLIQLFVLVVLIQAILSYFVDPYNPVRRFFDRLVNPFLAPIRRVIPLVGMFDFSPLILIILLQILDSIIMWLFTSLL
jgi:YggT family protein